MAEQAFELSVEWSAVSRCRPGELTSGDLGIVEVRHDETLVAGIDGLGHGGEAARAAKRAADVILSLIHI